MATDTIGILLTNQFEEKWKKNYCKAVNRLEGNPGEAYTRVFQYGREAWLNEFIHITKGDNPCQENERIACLFKHLKRPSLETSCSCANSDCRLSVERAEVDISLTVYVTMEMNPVGEELKGLVNSFDATFNSLSQKQGVKLPQTSS